MFFYQGLSCPHCTQPFDEHDDIVACPICGAPHHRDCWKEGNGCACADAHGTPEQWSRESAQKQAVETDDEVATVTCPRCGSENPEGRTLCNTCGTALKETEEPSATPFGAPMSDSFHEYAPFRVNQPPCGGVAPDTEIRGETAADIAEVVGTNTQYYMKRFARMAKGAAVFSWNWAAFILPDYWLLFRKNYLLGGLVLAFRVMCSCALNLVSYNVFADALEADTTVAMWESMNTILNGLDPVVVLLIYFLFMSIGAATVMMHVLCGVFGNFLYLKHCTRVIKKSRAYYPEGYRARLAIVGGTSAALAVVGFMCYQLLTNLVVIL